MDDNLFAGFAFGKPTGYQPITSKAPIAAPPKQGLPVGSVAGIASGNQPRAFLPRPNQQLPSVAQDHHFSLPAGGLATLDSGRKSIGENAAGHGMMDVDGDDHEDEVRI